MKKIITLIFTFLLLFSITSCGNNQTSDDNQTNNEGNNQENNNNNQDTPLYTYYTVSFDTQGGSLVEDIEIMEGNPIPLFDNPTRENYNFVAWYLSTQYLEEERWDFSLDRVNNDLTLYAKWEEEEVLEPSVYLVYELNEDGSSYTVTDYEADEEVVVIPNTYEGLPVTRIQGNYGTGALARKNVREVYIPDSIIEIGQNSFNNCSNLEYVHINTTSNLSAIGNNAFSGNSSLKEFYIPLNMINLGNSVFNNCGSIERFIVAEGNTRFSSANGHLIDLETNTLIRGSNGNNTIPDNVSTIASAAFRRSQLTSLVIPRSVTNIENYIIANSDITSIDYLGTELEWNNITKANLWNMGKDEIVINFMNEEVNVYLVINDHKLLVNLEDNSSVDALIELLREGDITYEAHDYGDFEKVGNIGHTLPQNNQSITTTPGDVILYTGNNICIYYDTNTWNFTKLGHIDITQAELKEILDAGGSNITVTITLE